MTDSKHRVVRSCITTHLPLGGLYFIDHVAAMGGLELVIVQRPAPPAAASPYRRLRSLAGRIKRSLPQLRPFAAREMRILRRELPEFSAAHCVDDRKHLRLEALARRHGFETAYVENINRNEPVLDALRRSQASWMFVLGGKILKPNTLDAFKGCWVNGHGGVLPDYRGLFSEYWALTNGEPDKVGCTVHQLVADVDAGAPLRESRIAVTSGETLGDLVVRNHANLIRTYLDVARDLIVRGQTMESLSGPMPAPGAGGYFSNPKGRDAMQLLQTNVEALCPHV